MLKLEVIQSAFTDAGGALVVASTEDEEMEEGDLAIPLWIAPAAA